jgi:hypothetical protein
LNNIPCRRKPRISKVYCIKKQNLCQARSEISKTGMVAHVYDLSTEEEKAEDQLSYKMRPYLKNKT